MAFLADPTEPAPTEGIKSSKARKKSNSSTQTLTFMLRYVASASLAAPLYAVAVDMDVHPHLAAPTKVCFQGPHLWPDVQV